MIHLRKMMLEELQRRNFAQTTVQYYLQAVEEFAAYFGKPPDQLSADHLRPQPGLPAQRAEAAATAACRCPSKTVKSRIGLPKPEDAEVYGRGLAEKSIIFRQM